MRINSLIHCPLLLYEPTFGHMFKTLFVYRWSPVGVRPASLLNSIVRGKKTFKALAHSINDSLQILNWGVSVF